MSIAMTASTEDTWLAFTLIFTFLSISQYILPPRYTKQLDTFFRKSCIFPCRYAHNKITPLPSPFHEIRVWFFVGLQAFWALWLVEQYEKTSVYKLTLSSNSTSLNLNHDLSFDTGDSGGLNEKKIHLTLKSFLPDSESSFLFAFEDDGLTNAIAILEVTLAFAISLSMNTSLTQYSSSIRLFNAYTGDIVAFAIELVAFLEARKIEEAEHAETKTFEIDKSKKESKEDMEMISNPKSKMNPSRVYIDTTMLNLRRLFQTLYALPNVTKHEFRGDTKWEDIVTFQESRTSDKKHFRSVGLLDSEVGRHIGALIKDNESVYMDKEKTKGLSESMLIMLKILDYVGDLCDRERRQRLASVEDKFDIGDPTRKTLKLAWRKIHSSYGDMETTVVYSNPSVIKTAVEFGLLASIFLLPLSNRLYSMGSNSVLVCCIVQFFIVGIYFSSVRVKNVYLSTNESFGFKNVTPVVKQTQFSILQIWISLKKIAQIDGQFFGRPSIGRPGGRKGTKQKRTLEFPFAFPFETKADDPSKNPKKAVPFVFGGESKQNNNIGRTKLKY